MTNEFKGRTGINRILHATRNSFNGLWAAYTGESAFRQETWLAVVLLPSALWLGRNALEVALLAATVVLVLIVELLNSAIEAVVDRVSFDWHDLSKRAKDIASAAVLLSLLLCASIWLTVIAQRFFLT
jgi:diacylglycerol kinase (ATP)